MTTMPDKIGKISVVIPCRNEEGSIRRCLQSLLDNAPVGNGLEILVVDGMSSDATRSIVLQFAKSSPNIKFLDNPGLIQASAMNIGIRASKGDVIVRLDAHSEYGNSYIKDCVNLLFSSEAANAGGRVRTVPGGAGLLGVPFARVTSHPMGVGNSNFRTGVASESVDTVPFGTFRKDLFEKIGYFDERLTRNEDDEFNERITKAGYKIAFDPAIEIIYKNQSTFKGILSHTFFSSMWNIYAIRLHSYAWRPRRFIPFGFVLYLILLFVLTNSLPLVFLCVLYLPLIVYFGLISVASASSEYSLRQNILTFFTFFIYHVTYGLGTLWGLLNLSVGTWKKYLGRPLK